MLSRHSGKLMIVLALFALVGTAVGVSAQGPTQRHIASAVGWTKIRGQNALVEILFEVPAGADEASFGRQLLRSRGAQPLQVGVFPSAFSLTGSLWDQFYDGQPSNDFVVQYYNPATDPTGGGGLTALLNAQTTWSTVPTSFFRFEFGGTTTRCPSTVPECGIFELDGFNDLGWVALNAPSILGIAYVSYFIDTMRFVEADVALNTGFPWFTDGRDFDVETVMLHENGHVAGLDHSDDATAVMYYSYEGVRRALSQDDIEGISFLYPAGATEPPTIPTPTPFPTVPPPPTPTPIPTIEPDASFSLISALGQPAPGGGTFEFDFEPGSLTNHGQAAFVADVSTGGEGVFLAQAGQLIQLVRSGEPAPGGGTLGPGIWGLSSSNEGGDVAFVFALEPFSQPAGLNAGVYRYTRATGDLSAVVVPYITPAPGGGTFQGAFGTSINNQGDLVFGGIVQTTEGISGDLGMGVFRADKNGHIVAIASPGDLAPGGGTFDFASDPQINDAGDIVFQAHVKGEACITSTRQSRSIHCFSSVYLWRARTGLIESIVHQGDPAPGGGVFRLAVGPALNNRGEVLFVGDLTKDPDSFESLGLFTYTQGAIVPIVRPGDPLPGGGYLRRVGRERSNWSLNNAGEVAFTAALDSDFCGGDCPEFPHTGLYTWSNGALQLVARTGTLIPGVGIVDQIHNPVGVGPWPTGSALINDRGLVFFQAILFDGTGVLLMADPAATVSNPPTPTTTSTPTATATFVPPPPPPPPG